jgi:hypothetical protein
MGNKKNLHINYSVDRVQISVREFANPRSPWLKRRFAIVQNVNSENNKNLISHDGAIMTFSSQNPLGYTGIVPAQNPPTINANRVPTTNDIQLPGTTWIYNGTIYETSGNGVWDSGGNVQATTTIAGITRYATYTEVSTGAGTNNATVANDVYTYVNSVMVAGAPVATTSTQGIVTLATDVKAVAGTPSTGLVALCVQPSNLAAVFAAPPAIGGTTPAAAVFTTIGGTTMTFTAGGTWKTGGTAISIGADATTDTINIGTGAAARTIHIGDSTQANLLTIGSASGAAALTLKAGTGNFVLTTAADTTITMGAAQVGGTVTIGGTAATGTMTLGSSSATNSILIGDGAGTTTVNISNSNASGAVNIGAAMVAGTVTIGGTAATGTITLGSSSASNTQIIAGGTGATTLQIANAQTGGSVVIGTGMTSGTISIGGSAHASATSITLGSSSATSTVLIANGAGASTVSIANGTAGANVVNICNGATAVTQTVNILSGVGSANGGAVHIGNNTRMTVLDLANIAPAAARTVTVCGGNQAQNDTLAVLNGNATANTQTYNLLSGVGSGTHTKAVNICNTTMSAGTATVNIMSATATGGTLAVNIVGDSASMTAVTTKICTGAAAHVLSIGSASAGLITVTGSAASGMNFVGSGGTIGLFNDAAANAITLGSTTASASLTLQSGSGGNTLIAGNAAATITIGLSTQTGKISIANSTAGLTAIDLMNGVAGTAQTLNIASGSTITGAQTVNLLNGATPAASTTLSIMNGAASAGTQTVNILASGATRAGVVNIGTGAAAHAVTLGTTNTTAATVIAAGSGSVKLNSGQIVKVTSKAHGDSSYAVLGSDYFLSVDCSGGIFTATLPAVPVTGQTYVIYDATGNAAGNTITIDGNGNNISAGGTSAGTKTLTTAYASMTLYFNGTIWNGQKVT